MLGTERTRTHTRAERASCFSTPLVLAGVVLTLLLLGLLAAWIPAQRALRADPLILLREE